MKKNEREAIVRTRKNRENPYVMVDKFGINDERLSWKSKGILVYLLSKPDDWTVRVSDLVNHAKDGRDSVLTGLRELENLGYVSREYIRESGKFRGLEYIIYERPQPADMNGFSPKTGNPFTENPKTGNPTLLINNFNNKDLTNKKNDDDNIKKESKNSFQEAFVEEAINQKMPKEEIESISESIKKDNIQFNLIVLQKTIEFVMNEYKNTNKTISSFKSYFLSALKNNQKRYDYVQQLQENEKRKQLPSIEFEFYNWLEDQNLK